MADEQIIEAPAKANKIVEDVKTLTVIVSEPEPEPEPEPTKPVNPIIQMAIDQAAERLARETAE